MVKLAKRSELQGNFNRAFLPPLDTLVQLGKSPLKTSDKASVKNLQKRARSKWYTTAIAGAMIYLDSPLKKYYQRAYYCAHTLKQTGNKITTSYCNTRICHVCNRIRSAKMMNGYVNQFMELEGTEFVTLTVPNCSAEDLNATIDLLLKTWKQIADVLKKRKLSANGIRKIETTYNIRENTFHPHLHILIDKGLGQMVVDEWMKRFPQCSIAAQKVLPADQNSLKEIFKYTTKIGIAKKGTIQICIPALDKIMIAMASRRSIQTFGKIKKVSEDVEELEAVEYDDLPVNEDKDASGNPMLIEWQWNECDWVRVGTAMSTLTGYVPPEIAFEFLE